MRFDEQSEAAKLLDVARWINTRHTREQLLREVGRQDQEGVAASIDRIAFALRFNQWAQDNPGRAVMAQIENWDSARIYWETC